MDFANILQSMKTEKSVKYLKFRAALDSLRAVWQVFGTFLIFQAKQFWEVQMLAMIDGMPVDKCTIYVWKRSF